MEVSLGSDSDGRWVELCCHVTAGCSVDTHDVNDSSDLDEQK